MKQILILLPLLALIQAAPDREGRLIGAKNVTSAETYPYQVQILYQGGFRCSGAIYSNNIVITTAVCLRGNPLDISVKVGTVIQGDASGEIYAASKVTAHENESHNIGLIFTAKRISYKKGIQPVAALATQVPAAFTSHNVTGWGVTSHGSSRLSTVLQVSPFYVGSAEFCNGWPATTREGILCLNSGIEHGICDGDSGDPAVIDGELMGVASFSSSTVCGSGYPMGFSSIPYFRDWIINKAQLLQNENN